MKKMTNKIIMFFAVLIILFSQKTFASCVNPDPANFWTWSIELIYSSPVTTKCTYYPLYWIMTLDTLDEILLFENCIMCLVYVVIFFIWLKK